MTTSPLQEKRPRGHLQGLVLIQFPGRQLVSVRRQDERVSWAGMNVRVIGIDWTATVSGEHPNGDDQTRIVDAEGRGKHYPGTGRDRCIQVLHAGTAGPVKGMSAPSRC